MAGEAWRDDFAGSPILQFLGELCCGHGTSYTALTIESLAGELVGCLQAAGQSVPHELQQLAARDPRHRRQGRNQTGRKRGRQPQGVRCEGRRCRICWFIFRCAAQLSTFGPRNELYLTCLPRAPVQPGGSGLGFGSAPPPPATSAQAAAATDHPGAFYSSKLPKAGASVAPRATPVYQAASGGYVPASSPGNARRGAPVLGSVPQRTAPPPAGNMAGARQTAASTTFRSSFVSSGTQQGRYSEDDLPCHTLK